MMIPAVSEWAKRLRLSPSKLMIPLSYAAILGGTCSVIGTSSNLVVNALMGQAADTRPLGMFEIAWIGLPGTLVGMLFILTLGRWLLPERRPAISKHDDPREYTAEMMVEPNSPLVGRTLEEAGLRSLPGAYVAEIDREGDTLAAVSSTERLRANDRLVFVGLVETVVDLQKMRGLTPATDQVFKLDSPRSTRTLIEAVVSPACPLVGKSVREGRFRSVYDAAVIAVARNGERVRAKIGDIVLRAGDTLLLEARAAFVEQQRNSRDFFLVSPIQDSAPPRHERAPLAIGILAGMVAAVTAGWLPMMTAAMVAAGLMIVSGCCRPAVARRSVDWSVLLVIAASIGLGEALMKTGAASTLANALIGLARGDPWLALAAVYVVTALTTASISNVAAAVLVFPIALQTAQNLDASFTPFAVVVMIAASKCFATPIGYQTNLMVFGPGGYRFADYLRIGVPLTVVIGLVTVLLVPQIWPLTIP
jgi:di/tricarboxylate transporter